MYLSEFFYQIGCVSLRICMYIYNVLCVYVCVSVFPSLCVCVCKCKSHMYIELSNTFPEISQDF